MVSWSVSRSPVNRVVGYPLDGTPRAWARAETTFVRFQIRHRTEYRYSLPVSLARQTLRFLPRSDRNGELVAYRLEIWPEPTQLGETLDPWGNRILTADFQGATRTLGILVDLQFVTAQPRVPQGPDWGVPNREEIGSQGLMAYLEPLDGDAALEEFTAPLWAACKGNAETFLRRLNAAVHRFYHHGVRLEGPPQTPSQTIASRAGVCRDLAVLFMAACRHVGIPAGFVSGYQSEPGRGVSERRYLHAWAEVFRPAVGWMGYDSTHGTPVADGHVAVACAPDPQETTPVSGSYSFCGECLTSTLDVEVEIAAV